VRTSGTTWVTSPSADKRKRHKEEDVGAMVLLDSKEWSHSTPLKR